MAKPKYPKAQLNTISNQTDGTLTLSTSGTKAAPGSSLKSWIIEWGDNNNHEGSGNPPTQFDHQYAASGQYNISFIVKDHNSYSDGFTMSPFIIRRTAATSPPLVITCPSNQFAQSLDGNPVAVNYPPAVASGGTPPYNYTYNPVSGSSFPVDVTTVNVSVTDSSVPQKSASCSFTVTVSLSPPPPIKTVLNPATDLVFLGVLRPPPELAAWPIGMTSRIVGGQFRLISWSRNNSKCLEWVPGTPTMDQTFAGIPNSSYLRDYGQFFGTYGGFALEPGSISGESINDMYPDAIHWRESEQALYYLVMSYYNNAPGFLSCPNIGKAIETSPGIFSPQGFWYTDEPFPTGFGNRWCNNLTELPDWLANGYLGGRKIGIGGGSQYWQGIEANNISQIPTLFALNPITPNAQSYLAKLNSVPIPLMYCHYYAFGNGLNNPVYPDPYNNAYTVTPRIGRRPSTAQLINKYANPNNDHYPGAPAEAFLQDPIPNGGRTYLTSQDQNHAMIYIDGPNRHGLLYCSTLAHGYYDQRIISATLYATVGSTQIWNIEVPTTVGLEPNMTLYLEAPDAAGYGGWVAMALHNNGIYAPNLPGGNTSSPILDSTHVLIANLESPTWDATKSVGFRLCAGYWYALGGWRTSTNRTWFSVYDPTDIAAQAVKGYNTGADYSEVEPKYWTEMPFDRRRETNVFSTTMPNCTAFAVDYQAKILYAAVMGADLGPNANDNFPLIYCYSIPNL